MICKYSKNFGQLQENDYTLSVKPAGTVTFPDDSYETWTPETGFVRGGPVMPGPDVGAPPLSCPA